METITVAMRMPPELDARIKTLARREHRNRSQMMLHLLEAGLAQQEPTQSGAAFRLSGSDGCAAPDPVAAAAWQPAS